MKNTNLIKSRNNAMLTQTELSEKVGISIRAYKLYESGERFPRVDIALKLAQVLNTTVEQLFRDKGGEE